jgi:hypothetical protein
MPTHIAFIGLIAGLFFGSTACAGQWFTVTSPGLENMPAVVEIDLESLRAQAPGGEAVIRVSTQAVQPHAGGFGFRSFVATAHFDCAKRNITLSSAAYFALPAGQGARLGADSAAKETGMPAKILDIVPPLASQALVRAACASAPPS